MHRALDRRDLGMHVQVQWHQSNAQRIKPYGTSIHVQHRQTDRQTNTQAYMLQAYTGIYVCQLPQRCSISIFDILHANKDISCRLLNIFDRNDHVPSACCKDVTLAKQASSWSSIPATDIVKDQSCLMSTEPAL